MKRRKPGGCYGGVIVQKEQQGAARGTGSGVAPGGEAQIFLQPQAREPAAEQSFARCGKFCGGGVRGTVVHYQNFGKQRFSFVLRRQRAQTGQRRFPEIPGRDDD